MQPRIAGRNFLFVPGPTNVPDRVQRAMMVAMEDHRSSKFPELSTSVLHDLKKVFKTESGQAFIFPSSGTGAWEAALTNTLSPGDKILAARFGQFSHLWIDMAQRLGFDVQVVEVEWGEGVPLQRYEEILSGRQAPRDQGRAGLSQRDRHRASRAISPACAARWMQRDHPALLYVDAVSSLASIDFRMDDWQVDLAVSGSQKGLMLPAGLGILAVSEKALGAMAGGQIQALLLRPGRHDQGQCDRLLPLHAVAADAVRVARVAQRHIRRGAGDHLLPPPLPGRGCARRHHRRVAPRSCAPRSRSGIRTP